MGLSTSHIVQLCVGTNSPCSDKHRSNSHTTDDAKASTPQVFDLALTPHVPSGCPTIPPARHPLTNPLVC